MTIAGKILKKIDEFGNWLCGGNITNTISARLGYFENSDPVGKLPLWHFLASFVDLAFFPIDGPRHCNQALVSEMKADNEEDFQKGSKLMMFFLSLIVIGFCIPIAVILYTYQLIRNVHKA